MCVVWSLHFSFINFLWNLWAGARESEGMAWACVPSAFEKVSEKASLSLPRCTALLMCKAWVMVRRVPSVS